MREVVSFFHQETSTLSHVLFDQKTKDGVIIDPALDFDLTRFSTGTKSVENLVRFCQERFLSIHYILETHAHADHLSASQTCKKYFPKAKIGIGREITVVQKYFADLFDLGPNFPQDGSQFDFLFSEKTELDVGSFAIKAWHTPGHTPACYTLQSENKYFVGDTLFAPDLGTGRCDFPGGDAKTLYHSIKNKIYQFPDSSVLYLGHDYPDKRDLREWVPITEEKTNNLRLNMQTQEVDFIKFRQERDRQLALPRLLFPSLFINIAAGRMPPLSKNGKTMISIPLNAFEA